MDSNKMRYNEYTQGVMEFLHVCGAPNFDRTLRRVWSYLSKTRHIISYTIFAA